MWCCIRILILPLLLGCAAPKAQGVTRGAPRPDGPGLSLLMQAVSTEDGKRRQLLPSGTLATGDRLALWVEVDQPAYLYVAHQDEKGALSILFPEKGDQLIPPGKLLRIPVAGQSFEVTGGAGEENMVVLASLRPEEPLRVLGQAPPPPPPTVDYATRQGAGDPILSTRFGKNGVAVLRFPFRHR